MTRTSINWGVPVPWDAEHVFYVWFDALINYATAVGYGEDTERFDTWWPAVHHLIGKDILRFHCVYWPAMCMAAGIDPPHRYRVTASCWSAARRCPRRRSTRSRRPTSSPTSASTGSATTSCATSRSARTATSPTRRMVARYNADLANNLGNLLARVATVVEPKCGGIGPAPSPTARWPRWRREVYRRPPSAWAAHRPERGARGHLAAGPRGQRRARGGRAVEGRAGPGGRRGARRRPRGAAHRRGPGLPRP